MTTIKTQKFGVEIELTGLTRATAINTLADTLGYPASGNTVRDTKGRYWKIVSDASIRPTMYGDGIEVVSPILSYDDIELVQSVLRALRMKGAIANDSCGIHVHVDGANHTPLSLKNVMNFMCARQDLIYEALAVKENRIEYCKKICPALNKKFKRIKDLTRANMKDAWYSAANHNYNSRYDRSDEHYNQTRYQCLNLHSYFYRGTVEFRMFNGTTHAGELKAYIQFALAVSAWAITANDSNVFKNIGHYTAEQKADIMVKVLTKRLKMIGAEFKTARLHLTKNLKARVTAMAA